MTPFVRIETPPRYARGMPAFAAVTVENRELYRVFGNLPLADVLDRDLPIEFRLDDEVLIPASDPVCGFRLHPGESRRMLVDLAPLPEGRFELRARYARGAESAPVAIEVLDGAAVPEAALARFLSRGAGSIEDVDAFARGFLEPEAAAFRAELLAERGDPAWEREADEAVRRWPSIRWRIDEVRSGFGRLALWRTIHAS